MHSSELWWSMKIFPKFKISYRFYYFERYFIKRYYAFLVYLKYSYYLSTYHF